jgi:hypothetical protein
MPLLPKIKIFILSWPPDGSVESLAGGNYRFPPFSKTSSGGCMNEKETPLHKIIEFIISNIANSIVILYAISNSDAEYGLLSATGSGADRVE